MEEAVARFIRVFSPFRLFPFSPFPPFLAVFLALCILVAPPVAAQGTSAAPKIPVAASISPLGDFSRNVGGERVEVMVLIPPGASPHVFEPTPQAVAQAMRSRVFVYVGAGLDPWAERLLAARRSESLAVVEAVAGLELIQDASHSHHHGHGGHEPHGHGQGHSHEQGNPHVWLDPVLAQDICRRIAAALIQVDPAHRETYESNLSRYLEELEALHQESAHRIAAWRLREFVSFHPSFTYFARRYGLKEVGVIEAAPGREPTPAHIRAIVSAIRKYGVRVVFTEPQLSPRVAEVIAREAGVRVSLVDPLGGRPPYGDAYLKLMRFNLDAMERAMQ
jgi:zinc transport system substrate-binding protein